MIKANWNNQNKHSQAPALKDQKSKEIQKKEISRLKVHYNDGMRKHMRDR